MDQPGGTAAMSTETGAAGRAARPELRGLTGLRGVAALLVVLGHYHVANLPWLNLLDLQNVAVDLFFALSAFTLLYVYDAEASGTGGRFSYRSFLGARVARVMPLNLLAVVAAGLITAGADPAFTARPGWLLDGARQALLVNGWPGVGSFAQWDLPAWSISVEALCYLAFPVFLLLYRALRRASPTLLTVLPLAALTASALVSVFWFKAGIYSWSAAPPGTHAAIAGTLKAVLGFAAGVAAYRCWASRNIAAAAADRLCDATVAGVAVVCGLAASGMVERQFAVLLCPALILGAAGAGSVSARVLASRPVHFLGLISYALYLVHFPIKDAFAFYAPAIDPANLPGFLIELACALLVAALCHAVVEKPARLILRRAFGVWRRPQVA